MTITDESQVPNYTLPDPLIMADGSPVTDAETWHTRRRPEILALFESQVYGRAPDLPKDLHAETFDHTTLADGMIRQQVRIDLVGEQTIMMLIFRPAVAAKGTFLALNFRGNHTIHPAPGIIRASGWIPVDEYDDESATHEATEASRGSQAQRWAVHQILEQGYALATIYAGDIRPDRADTEAGSVQQYFFTARQRRPEFDRWGAIAAWAWGLRRALDYLERDTALGPVIVMGHSRMGKAALWAGATDPRFALVISNESGCGGAALSRRRFGETLIDINSRFPHWFCRNFHAYDQREHKLPVDQHQLLALIAPRPLYVASAQDDLWADPRGEFLSAYHADPVYKLLGTSGLPASEQPPLDQPVMGQIGYHMRSGPHSVTAFDWTQYLRFADKHLA